MTKIPSEDVLASLYKVRIRESDQLKNRIAQLSEVEDDGEKKPGSENLTPETRKLRQEQWSRVAGDLVVLEGDMEFACSQWKAKGQCLKGDQSSFRHERHDREKPDTESRSILWATSTKRQKCVEKKEPQRPKPVWEVQPTAVQNFLKGTCTKLPCDYWRPPKCKLPIPALEGWRTTKEKRVMTKVQLLLWKVHDSWVVYHRTLGRQILQRFLGTAQKRWNQFDEYDSRGLHCVKQTSEKIRSVAWQNTRKNPHQGSPHAMKFEDRSPRETARPERCARGDAWELAKKILELKKEDKVTFYLPSEEWILPAASTINPE